MIRALSGHIKVNQVVQLNILISYMCHFSEKIERKDSKKKKSHKLIQLIKGKIV